MLQTGVFERGASDQTHSLTHSQDSTPQVFACQCNMLFLIFNLFFCSGIGCRFVTYRSVWRRCWSGINLPTIPTGLWRSAHSATRSSPATTTSKCTWRTSTERRRGRDLNTHVYMFSGCRSRVYTFHVSCRTKDIKNSPKVTHSLSLSDTTVHCSTAVIQYCTLLIFSAILPWLSIYLSYAWLCWRAST